LNRNCQKKIAKSKRKDELCLTPTLHCSRFSLRKWNSSNKCKITSTKKTRALTRARILLDNPEITEEEIEMALHGNFGLHLFAKNDAATRESRRFVQDRSSEIKQLEQSLQEVHQLFLDMAVLVQQQGEMVDRVGVRVSNIKRDITDGKTQLIQAQKIKRGFNIKNLFSSKKKT